MPQLYHLLAGTSKKRLKPIMTDVLKKVENYKTALENSKCGQWATQYRHLEIVEAPDEADAWKKKKQGHPWMAHD
jgi:hypothetical protein